jgi:phospholipid transport system substrate-binding protein
MPSTFRRHALLVFLSLAALPATAHAEAAMEASIPKTTIEEKQAYARKFAEMVLSIIHDSKKSFGDRKTVLRDAFANSVDIDWIARFVIGKSWKTATEEQKKQYSKTYRRYLTESYVANFAENPKKRIRDIKIHNVFDANDEDFTVQTEMLLADMENLRVSYLVNENEGHYRVRDIAIEHVSLINTHRSEIAQMATNEGMDGVIKELDARVERMQQEQNSYSTQHASGN